MSGASRRTGVHGMKPRNYAKFCFLVSAVLAAVFCLSVIRGRILYETTLNSAPFSVWVLADAVYFLLPALIVLIAGLVLRHREKKKQES